MRLRSLFLDERGNISTAFALSLFVLFSTAGAAIDFNRWTSIKSKTQMALDAAVLAAAHEQLVSGDASKAISVGQNYFAEHITKRLPVTSSKVTFQLANDNTAMVGSASLSIETQLLGLVNIESLMVETTSQAAFSMGGGSAGVSDLEIALMLDVTGSMCSDGIGPCTSSSKLTALKDAAKNLINIVVKETGSQKTKVALVPFSTRVRVSESTQNGNDHNLTSELTNLNKKWSGWFNVCTNGTSSGGGEVNNVWVCHNYAPQEVQNWELFPCVTDRTGPQEFTDMVPGPDAWLNAHDGSRWPLSRDSTNNPPTNNLGTSGDPADHWNFRENAGTDCADVPPENVIVPLTDDKDELFERIDGLKAEGATSGALGTAWSWYMLSPEWSSLWKGASAPGSYSDLTATSGGAPKLRKIAVLMTDGVYNTYRGWKDEDPEMVSDNAVEICNNMKAKGIEIFTVGFELDSLPAVDRTRAIKTLKDCGTDIDHFFNSIDASELQIAFNSIAMSLAPLYLAK